MEILYRKAKTSDIHQLVNMRWDFQLVGKEKFRNSKKGFRISCNKFFKEQFKSGHWIHFVAEKNKEIIAHISLQIIKNIPIPGTTKNYWGYITNAYTKPDFRRKGIGTKLVKIAIAWADKNSLSKIVLWPRNTSINIYKGFGFSQKSNIMERKKRD